MRARDFFAIFALVALPSEFVEAAVRPRDLLAIRQPREMFRAFREHPEFWFFGMGQALHWIRHPKDKTHNPPTYWELKSWIEGNRDRNKSELPRNYNQHEAEEALKFLEDTVLKDLKEHPNRRQIHVLQYAPRVYYSRDGKQPRRFFERKFQFYLGALPFRLAFDSRARLGKDSRLLDEAKHLSQSYLFPKFREAGYDESELDRVRRIDERLDPYRTAYLFLAEAEPRSSKEPRWGRRSLPKGIRIRGATRLFDGSDSVVEGDILPYEGGQVLFQRPTGTTRLLQGKRKSHLLPEELALSETHGRTIRFPEKKKVSVGRRGKDATVEGERALFERLASLLLGAHPIVTGTRKNELEPLGYEPIIELDPSLVITTSSHPKAARIYLSSAFGMRVRDDVPQPIYAQPLAGVKNIRFRPGQLPGWKHEHDVFVPENSDLILRIDAEPFYRNFGPKDAHTLQYGVFERAPVNAEL